MLSNSIESHFPRLIQLISNRDHHRVLGLTLFLETSWLLGAQLVDYIRPFPLETLMLHCHRNCPGMSWPFLLVSFSYNIWGYVLRVPQAWDLI